MRQPSVPELLSQWSSAPREALGFVDWFCGIGGASEGARQAGLDVVLAVDSDQAAFGRARLSHPRAQHLCVELPVAAAELPLPTGQRFYAAALPVRCSREATSTALQTIAERRQRSCAGSLVALASDCVVWSMEQSPAREVVDFLGVSQKTRQPRACDTIMDFVEIGLLKTAAASSRARQKLLRA